MSTRRKSLDEIQYARAFAMIAVLLVHSSSLGATTLPYDSSMFSVYNFLNIAGKLGTPTFIMLSAFVLFYNYYPRKFDKGIISRFYKKRLLYILIPYFVFSLFYFVLKWYLYYDYPTIQDAAERFLYLFSLGKAHPHLYFVFISVQFYLMFPLLMVLFKRFEFLRKNAIWIGLAVQWIWVILNKEYFGIQLKGSISLSYFSFYFIGAYLGIYYDEIKSKMTNSQYRFEKLTTIFIGYGAMVVLYVGYMYLVRTGAYSVVAPNVPSVINSFISEFTWATHALFAGLALFAFAHWAERKWGPSTKRFFMELGATSFGIYLIHPALLMLTRALNSGGSPLVFNGWQLASFLFVGFGSWIIVRLFYKATPYYWIFFGKMSGSRDRK